MKELLGPTDCLKMIIYRLTENCFFVIDLD